MPQYQNRYWYESQRMIAVRDLPCYTTIYYTDVSIEMQRHTWMVPFLKQQLLFFFLILFIKQKYVTILTIVHLDKCSLNAQ